MTSAKIRIKVGSMELEYEGDHSFLTGGIEVLLETMGGLAAKVPEKIPQVIEAADQLPLVSGTSNNAAVVGGRYSFSTNTIAAHLEAKTAQELVICAMAQLELVQGKASSGRVAILTEMKNATTYYNENMRKNMTNALTRLTKSKRINQIATDSYALSANEKKKVEAKVAEIG
ncbi:MAG: hypothetical protein WAT70_02350 [Rhizobiaceae bacterium]